MIPQTYTGFEIDETIDRVAGLGWVITNPAAGALPIGEQVWITFGAADPVWCQVVGKLHGQSVVTR